MYFIIGLVIVLLMFIDYKRVGNHKKPLFGKDSGQVFDSGTIQYDCYLYTVAYSDVENNDLSSPGGPGGYIEGPSAYCTLGKYFLLPMFVHFNDVKIVR